MPAVIGQPVPDFEIKAYDRPKDGTAEEFPSVKLSDYHGKWVCLFFYPRDFTFVCPTEIVSFNQALDEFDDRNCAVLTASTDSEFTHKGWANSHDDLKKLRYPMLADTNHRLSEAFGIYDPVKGLAYRGIYLIDPTGVLRWMAVHDLSVGRNVKEVLRVLDALQTDKLCPCNWEKGKQTLN